MLEAAGIDKAPGTFDELQKAAQATTKGDRYGFGIFGKQGAAIVNGWLPFLFAAGGKIYDENTYEIFINQPQAFARALDFYGKLATQWKVIPPVLLDMGVGRDHRRRRERPLRHDGDARALCRFAGESEGIEDGRQLGVVANARRRFTGRGALVGSWLAAFGADLEFS